MDTRFIITLNDQYTSQMSSVVRAIADKGLKILKTYPYGVVIAEGKDQAMHQIKCMKEVSAVDLEQIIQLPPKDSNIQ